MTVLKKRFSVIAPFLGLVFVLAVLGIATSGQLFEFTNFNRI